MTGRARRQQVILDILQRQPVDSQEELRQSLGGRGIEVTQATLSRDLRELGAVKTPRGYQLPVNAVAGRGETARALTPLSRTMASFVTDVQAAGNLVVLRTGPGQAQIVALELDRAGLVGVTGCLAGDDTIFMAVVSAQRTKELTREMLRLAELAEASR